MRTRRPLTSTTMLSPSATSMPCSLRSSKATLKTTCQVLTSNCSPGCKVLTCAMTSAGLLHQMSRRCKVVSMSSAGAIWL